MKSLYIIGLLMLSCCILGVLARNTFGIYAGDSTYASLSAGQSTSVNLDTSAWGLNGNVTLTSSIKSPSHTGDKFTGSIFDNLNGVVFGRGGRAVCLNKGCNTLHINSPWPPTLYSVLVSAPQAYWAFVTNENALWSGTFQLGFDAIVDSARPLFYWGKTRLLSRIQDQPVGCSSALQFPYTVYANRGVGTWLVFSDAYTSFPDLYLRVNGAFNQTSGFIDNGDLFTGSDGSLTGQWSAPQRLGNGQSLLLLNIKGCQMTYSLQFSFPMTSLLPTLPTLPHHSFASNGIDLSHATDKS